MTIRINVTVTTAEYIAII